MGITEFTVKLGPKPKRIVAQAQKCGLEPIALKSINATIILDVSLELLDGSGTAHRVEPKQYGPFLKYLKRYKIPFEWAGGYTAILIATDQPWPENVDVYWRGNDVV